MVTPMVGTHFTSTIAPTNQRPVLPVDRTPDPNDNFIGQKIGLPGSSSFWTVCSREQNCRNRSKFGFTAKYVLINYTLVERIAILCDISDMNCSIMVGDISYNIIEPVGMEGMDLGHEDTRQARQSRIWGLSLRCLKWELF